MSARSPRRWPRLSSDGDGPSAEKDVADTGDGQPGQAETAALLRAAEETAARIRADAEAEAKQTRQAAEREARAAAARARRRVHELESEARRLEGQMRRVLGALRTITTQLDDLLGSDADASADRDAPVHAPSATRRGGARRASPRRRRSRPAERGGR